MQSDSVKSVSLAGLMGVGGHIDGARANKGAAEGGTFTAEVRKLMEAAAADAPTAAAAAADRADAPKPQDADLDAIDLEELFFRSKIPAPAEKDPDVSAPPDDGDADSPDVRGDAAAEIDALPQEDRLRMGNDLLAHALKQIAAILGLPDDGDAQMTFEFDDANIEQLAAIAAYLDLTIKMANDRIDVSANAESANMAMAACGIESPIAHIEPEQNAAELSEFAAALRAEKFRMDMAFRLIGIGGMIAERIAEKSSVANTAAGIPQAVNPADLGMSVADTVSAFSNLIREEFAASADRVRQIARGQAEMTDLERAAVELGTVKSEILKAALSRAGTAGGAAAANTAAADTGDAGNTGADINDNADAAANAAVDNAGRANGRENAAAGANATVNVNTADTANANAGARADVNTVRINTANANVPADAKADVTVNTAVNNAAAVTVNGGDKNADNAGRADGANANANTANAGANADTGVNTVSINTANINTANINTANINTANINTANINTANINTANTAADADANANTANAEPNARVGVNTVSINTANINTANINTANTAAADANANPANAEPNARAGVNTVSINTANINTADAAGAGANARTAAARARADVNTVSINTADTADTADADAVTVNAAEAGGDKNVDSADRADRRENANAAANTAEAKPGARVGVDKVSINTANTNVRADANTANAAANADLPISAGESAGGRRRRPSLESANRLASLSAERAAGAKTSSSGDSAELPLSVMALAHGKKAAKPADAEIRAASETPAQPKNAVAGGETAALPVSVMESAENKPARKPNGAPAAGARAAKGAKEAARAAAGAADAAVEAAKTDKAAAGKAADDAFVAKLRQAVEAGGLIKNKGGKPAGEPLAKTAESGKGAPQSGAALSSSSNSVGADADIDADRPLDDGGAEAGGAGPAGASGPGTATAKRADKADAPAAAQEDRFEVIRQLSERLGNAVRAGANEVRMVLRPEALGEVRMSLRIQGDVVFARMQVENKQVKAIVESNLQSLKDSLNRQNLEFGALDVEVGAESDGGRSPRELWQEMADRAESRGFRQAVGVGVDGTPVDGGPDGFVSLGSDTGRRFGGNTFEYFA